MRYLVGQDLVFRHSGRAVLHGVSLRVARGRASVLVGPSGSGKTTLIWLLAGLLEPAAGRVGLVEGSAGAAHRACGLEPNAQADSAPRAIDHGRVRIGMVFQQPALWDHLTVEKHLQLVLAGKGLARSERRRRTDRTLSQMRLGQLRRRRPAQLSGGERQRLAIARALVIGPEWLFLDEPLAHLDGPVRGELFELLRAALAEARAGVLMATHNAAEALRLADDVVILLDGRIAQAGPAETVYRQPVNLAAARALGPACEIAGHARQGVLACDCQPVLENLAASQSGPTRMILRPEDVEFGPDPAGPAVVRRCEFVNGAYHLYVRAPGVEAVAAHPRCLPAGTLGRLCLRRPEPG